MQKRDLGQTGIAVSQIGLGTVKFGRNEGVKYPQPFALPTDAEIAHLLAVSKSLGINLLDTAPAYGESEVRLGKALKNQRHDWVICTKAGESFETGESRFDFSALAIIASVEKSLSRLQTDYLDILLIHSHGDDVKLIEQEQVFHTAQLLKKTGKIRAFGMSTKTIAGGLLTIDHADLAMVTFNSGYTDEKAVIDYAHKKQKGIFVKKALASGHIQSPTEALQFIFQTPGVTSVIMGTLNEVHLRENVTAANGWEA